MKGKMRNPAWDASGEERLAAAYQIVGYP